MKLKQSPRFRLKNSREESDWPGLYQVPISDLMVVAEVEPCPGADLV